MNGFEKWALGLTTIATAVTGLGLLVTKYLMQTDDPWAVINHPLQPWFLKAHIVIAPTLVFALGMVAARHVWPYLKTGLRSGLRSGIVTTLVTVPMVLSGQLIQIITAPGWLKGIAVLHIATALLFTTAFVGHRLRVHLRRSGERKQAAGAMPEGARPS